MLLLLRGEQPPVLYEDTPAGGITYGGVHAGAGVASGLPLLLMLAPVGAELVLATSAVGGTVLGGSVSSAVTDTNTVAGGVTLDGAAITVPFITDAETAGIVLAGVVTVELGRGAVVAGGVLLAGQAAQALIAAPVPAGGIVLGGSVSTAQLARPAVLTIAEEAPDLVELVTDLLASVSAVTTAPSSTVTTALVPVTNVTVGTGDRRVVVSAQTETG